MKRKALAGMIAVIAALAIIIMAIGGGSKGKQPVSGEEITFLLTSFLKRSRKILEILHKGTRK